MLLEKIATRNDNEDDEIILTKIRNLVFQY